MWIFKEFNSILPKKVTPPTVEELIALLAHDNKCRFEFLCVAGLQLATRKGLAFWPFKIRAVQGHSEKAVQKAAASDTFNATLFFAGGGTPALSKASLTGKPRATLEETPGVIYHHTSRADWKSIRDDGLVPGGGERVSSGRAHSYVADRQVSEEGYVSGVCAQRPIEIRVAMKEAAQAGIIFIKPASEGILTKDAVPAQFILSVEDTEKKASLYVRHDATEQAARSTGAERSAKQHVAAFEGRVSPRAQTGEVASSSTDVPKQFAGKFKAPPPIRLPDMPGFVASREPQTPPPKVEAPKEPSPRSEPQKAKSPRPTTPKVESPRPALPKAKAESPKAVAKATTEEPAQKKAALTSVPKPVPAAKPPAAPPATAKLLEQSAKPPPKETLPKPSEAAATTAPKSHGAGSTPKSHGAGSTPKSLGKETTPKQQPAAPAKEAVTAVKIEVGSCSRCFAQTFQRTDSV